MERKEQIINVAHELIDRGGYPKFSYADLEKKLKIRKASIHHHFAKKEDLGLAVLDYVEAYLLNRKADLKRSQGDAWSKVLTFIHPSCAAARESGRVCTLSSMQADYHHLPDSLQGRVKTLCDLERQIITDILEEGRQKGTLNFEGTADESAATFLAALKGAMHYSRVFGQDMLGIVERSLKLFLGVKT